MRAFVTGATGFVGSHLVDQLRLAGARVTVLVRSRTKLARVFDDPPDAVEGDLADPDLLRESISGHDVVFHVAGLVAAANEAEFLRVNRDGTENVVTAASRAGARRFVLVSSLAARGPSTPGVPSDDDARPRPVTAYGRSKLAGEEVVRRSELEWCVVRPPMVYGPRDTELLKAFRVARIGFVPLFGSGAQELSVIHGADLARALTIVGGNPSVVGRTYYPCHPETVTSARLARGVGRALDRKVRLVTLPAALTRLILHGTGTIARLAGKTTILNADKANELLQPAWIGDPAPLMNETGWAPRFDLESGLADTVSWYRARGIL